MKTKNSKKVLALILSFFMILTVLPFNVMAEGADPAPTKTTAELIQEATAKIGEVETKLKAELEKVKDPDVKKTQTGALTNVVNGTKAKLGEVQDKEVSVAQPKIEAAMADFDNTTNTISQAVKAKLEEEKKQEDEKKVQDAKAEAISKLEAKEKEVKSKIDSIKDPTEKDKQQKALKEAVDAAKKAVNDVEDTSKPEEAEKTINEAVKAFEAKAEELKTAATTQIEKEKKAEETKELAEAKKAANTALEEKATERKAKIDKLDAKVYDIEKSKAKVDTALAAAKAEVEKATTKDKVTAAKEAGVDSIKKVEPVKKETPAPVKKELSVSANVYYDAITGKVVDGNNNPVKDALVKVLGRTTYTDKDGNFTFNMTSESGNYYCGYYGYYWKDYPYNSYKVDTSKGSYSGYNGSYARYYFLVDGNGNIVDSVYANPNSSYYLRGESYKTYTVYSSDYGYGYGYGYGYPYYDKYYNRYYNPSTSWAYGKIVTATKDGYEAGSTTLYNVTNNSWLYTTCYEYGNRYYYGYDRVIYPSALSLSGNGTIVSGKVGVSYLPIYVYRNGVFLGSGNADVNGYFSIGLNSRVSSTSDLTFYAYGKGQVAPEKKSEKADHGVIPVKSTVVIGSTKLIKNINGVEADVNMDVAPFIKDGRTMLPLRYIAEALGFKVDWDRATRTVTLTDKEFKVQIPVETNKIIVNGSTYYSDANPVLRNGRTMLPVANIARALGLKDGTDILWDANTRVATITRLVKY